ncbi:hypothetical protein FIBSPDRAFT_760636 [Athelia psychrophila]|uniref:Glutamate--tRNA ligase, mitochondrial n=1 Tax=Athelia psychrophila TaxID=1759441 RepID=A0A165XV26_9AGAM|nr:hypothetical protein FIBSPDRAFT_760636 [Fibularhizoctonia sp. CBS 109695]
MVLLRFAPSPTGALHLGGLRTALFNHLYAKKLGGKWVLRIDDTDATRYVPDAVQGIRSSLAWAGLEYDYGPEKGGPHGPYFQSQRLDLYQTYAKKLIDSGHAYRCFCSPDRLSEAREKLARTGSNATYDKACQHLTDEEAARRVRAGEKHIVRLNEERAPRREQITDLVFGPMKDSHAGLPTDPILLKTDLFPTYHLASVVDDYEMGITHVLRGEEWLPSLPLHLDLYAALQLPAPQYGHLPILLNPDGTKMSKRKGDVAVGDYMKRGWEPDALLNWLALAGWGAHHEYPTSPASTSSSPSSTASEHTDTVPDSTQMMTLPELMEQFDLSAITHRRNSLDITKLAYLNKRHLMRTVAEGGAALEDLARRVYVDIKEAFPESQYTSIADIASAITALESRLTTVKDIPSMGAFFFINPDWQGSEAEGMMRGIEVEDQRTVLDAVASRLRALRPTEPEAEWWTAVAFSDVLHTEMEAVGIKSKVFMTVLRHALTGMKKGPSVPDVMRALGEDRTFWRLKEATNLF